MYLVIVYRYQTREHYTAAKPPHHSRPDRARKPSKWQYTEKYEHVTTAAYTRTQKLCPHYDAPVQKQCALKRRRCVRVKTPEQFTAIADPDLGQVGLARTHLYARLQQRTAGDEALGSKGVCPLCLWPALNLRTELVRDEHRVGRVLRVPLQAIFEHVRSAAATHMREHLRLRCCDESGW